MIGSLGIYLVLLAGGCLITGSLLRRRRFRWAFLWLLLTAASLTSWYHALRIDVLAAILYPSDTIYAPSFTREKFATITKGLSEDDLVRRVGKPLSRNISSAELEFLHYSQAGSGSQNYWNFVVVVDSRTHVVTETFREFYVD